MVEDRKPKRWESRTGNVGDRDVWKATRGREDRLRTTDRNRTGRAKLRSEVRSNVITVQHELRKTFTRSNISKTNSRTVSRGLLGKRSKTITPSTLALSLTTDVSSPRFDPEKTSLASPGYETYDRREIEGRDGKSIDREACD